jgi:anaerobic selenocysteine-containing dehydrogenase
LASGHKYLDGITLEKLAEHGSMRLNLSPTGQPFLAHAEGGFGTPSGKCEFKADTLAYVPPAESRQGEGALLSRYPLELLSPKNSDSMNSTFGNRDDVDSQTDRAVLHERDAQARGIASGDLVRVFNARGSLRLPAEVTAKIHPGVVRIPSVRWHKNAQDGQSVNVLTPDNLTDIGGGAVFYSCLVEVERCGD